MKRQFWHENLPLQLRAQSQGPKAFLDRIGPTRVDPSKPGSRQKKRSGATEGLFRTRSTVRTGTIVSNFRAILNKSPIKSLLPMLKADAYGHGAEAVVKALATEKNLEGFGVATLEEGLSLRKALNGGAAKSRAIRILVFSDPFLGSDFEQAVFLAESYGLTLVLSNMQSLRAFFKNECYLRCPYEIKWNTGMNRLGVPVSESAEVYQLLKKRASDQLPSGMCTHFAQAELPDSPLTQKQWQKFRDIRRQFSSFDGAMRFHAANSAAIWNAKQLNHLEGCDFVRPGLSLYGVPPDAHAQAFGIEQALELEAKVLTLQKVKPGETVGYGGHFKNSTAGTIEIATLAVGYADGLLRSSGGDLQKQGIQACWNGQFTRFIGRVSMDLSAVLALPGMKIGDTVQYFGPNFDPWVQSTQAGTIPYEFLTSIGRRVSRIYG